MALLDAFDALAARVRRQAAILAAVNDAQAICSTGARRDAAFEALLGRILDLGGCRRGAIAARVEDGEGEEAPAYHVLAGPPPDPALEAALKAALATGNTAPNDRAAAMTRRDDVLALPLRLDGEILGVVALADCDGGLDRELAEELSPVVRALTRVLADDRSRRRREAAEQASRSKSAFLAQMNHELRTPLSGVIANLELLRGSDLTKAQRDLVEASMSAGKGLLSVIGDTLDLSKIEADKLTLEPAEFDVVEMIESVASIYRSAALQKETELSTAICAAAPRRIVADEMRLRQILCNLIGNAVKFTEAGRICLSLQAERIDGRTVRLYFLVDDTGVGFPAEAAASLFEPFKQADSSIAGEYGGSGLGLAIAHGLATLHGGEISCAAAPGAGASFKLSLTVPVAAWGPMAEWGVEATAAGNDPPPRRDDDAAIQRFAPGEAPSLLVVEDQPMNRKILERQLERLGIACDLAESGPDALTLLDHRHYEVIITDCAMPVMDGLELIRRIRAEEDAAGRPRSTVIALTANTLKGGAQACYDAGADAYLTKPLKLVALSAILAQDAPPRAGPAQDAPLRACPAPVDSAPGETAAPIDRAALAGLIGRDDPRLIDQLSRDFFDSWQGCFRTIVQQLAAQDAAWLAEAAHAAKGTAQYGAAGGLAAGCARLEQLARAGRWADAAAAVEDLKIETGRLQSHLTKSGLIRHEHLRSA